MTGSALLLLLQYDLYQASAVLKPKWDLIDTATQKILSESLVGIPLGLVKDPLQQFLKERILNKRKDALRQKVSNLTQQREALSKVPVASTSPALGDITSELDETIAELDRLSGNRSGSVLALIRKSFLVSCPSSFAELLVRAAFYWALTGVVLESLAAARSWEAGGRNTLGDHVVGLIVFGIMTLGFRALAQIADSQHGEPPRTYQSVSIPSRLFLWYRPSTPWLWFLHLPFYLWITMIAFLLIAFVRQTLRGNEFPNFTYTLVFVFAASLFSFSSNFVEMSRLRRRVVPPK
jgi:hypothetical protein